MMKAGNSVHFLPHCFSVKLNYRTVRFEQEIIDKPNYQGNAVVNYTEREVPYTRVIEHKHFEMFGAEVYDCPKTVISKEYSTEWKDGMEPYYPEMMSNKMSWTKAQPHSEVVSRFHKVRGNIRFFILLLFIHLSLFDSNLTDLHTQNFFDDRSHVVVLVLC